MRSLFHDFQAKMDVLQTSKELLDPREAELNRLKDEIEYKNTDGPLKTWRWRMIRR